MASGETTGVSPVSILIKGLNSPKMCPLSSARLLASFMSFSSLVNVKTLSPLRPPKPTPRTFSSRKRYQASNSGVQLVMPWRKSAYSRKTRMRPTLPRPASTPKEHNGGKDTPRIGSKLTLSGGEKQAKKTYKETSTQMSSFSTGISDEDGDAEFVLVGLGYRRPTIANISAIIPTTKPIKVNRAVFRMINDELSL